MAARDRFHQSLTLARQQVLDSVQHHREALGQRTGLTSPTAGPSTSAAAAPAGASDLQRNETLPLYSSRNHGPRVSSQAEADAYRRRQSSSNGGNAAQQEYKTVHVYKGAGGRAVLELHTPPQRAPIYMGGSAERGRGAMVGRLAFTPKPGERVSHITIKVKAVARVRVPVMNPHSPGPAQIAGRSPALEQTTERETLLLQLEQTLYTSSPANKDKTFEMPPGAAHDATVSWPFRFDIPGEDRGGRGLPASYVLTADAEAQPAKGRAAESRGGQLLSAGKGLLNSLKNVGQSEADANEWASVKWYIKLTIGRPSMLEVNDRIFVPFTYLPPPPTKALAVLDRRARTSEQLRQNVPFGQLMESSATWQEIGVGSATSLANANSGGGGGGLLGGLLGGLGAKKKKVETEWTLEMPSQPALYTLQGSIPFNLCTKSQKNLGAPLVVSLFKRVTLVARATRASDVRKVCSARIATAPVTLRSQQTGIATYRWQGVLDIPAHCGPCFDSSVLSLEYFVGIQERPDGPIVHAETIVLMCSPPRLIDASGGPPAPAQGVQLHDPQAKKPGKSNDKPALPVRPNGKPAQDMAPGPSVAGPSTAVAAVPAPGPAPAPAQYTAQPPPASIPGGSSSALAVPGATQHSGVDFDELDVAGMQLDLPPSYFEATGIRDAE